MDATLENGVQAEVEHSTETALVQQIAAARAAREKAAMAEFAELLKRHNCDVQYRQMWVNGQPTNQSQLVFVAK